jgi:hypothetical protein
MAEVVGSNPAGGTTSRYSTVVSALVFQTGDVSSNLTTCSIIDLWCNGNTSDFGSVILGSNPGRSTMGTSG